MTAVEALDAIERRGNTPPVAACARATGLGGPPRRIGSSAEKARLNVTRTIHLDQASTTGASCCYAPRGEVSWTT